MSSSRLAARTPYWLILAVTLALGCNTPGGDDDETDDDDVGDDDDDSDDDDDDDDDSDDDDDDSDDDDDATGCDPFEACDDTPTVTDEDGNVYDTVDICGQCWMAENLNTGAMMTVDVAAGPAGNKQPDDDTIQKFCMGDAPASCAAHGGLYQWLEAMDHTTYQSEGICPSGWHIPSDDEWKTLEINLGMSAADADEQSEWRGTDEGDQLKDGGAANFDAPLVGYAASVMGGYYDFANDGTSCGFWASSASGGNAWFRALHEDHSEIYRALYEQDEEALSVRCLRD